MLLIYVSHTRAGVIQTVKLYSHADFALARRHANYNNGRSTRVHSQLIQQ